MRLGGDVDSFVLTYDFNLNQGNFNGNMTLDEGPDIIYIPTGQRSGWTLGGLAGLLEIEEDVVRRMQSGLGNFDANAFEAQVNGWIATIVTGIRNSINGVGSRSAPVTASARVIECPTVNAVTTQSESRQSRPR